MNGNQSLLEGRITLRPDDRGQFDELICDCCCIHLEMMDDRTLWMAVRPWGHTEEVHVTVSARGKLKIVAYEA